MAHTTVIPPTMAHTTPYTPNAGLFINLDKQQFFVTRLQPNTSEMERDCNVLWDLLAVPFEPPRLFDEKHTAVSGKPAPASKKFTPTNKKPVPEQGRERGIHRMPPQMLDAIFHQIDNAQDAICLSLTSKLFATVGRRHVYALFREHSGRWAGDRVALVDPCMPLTDSDEGGTLHFAELWTDAEKARVQAFVQKYGKPGHAVQMGQFVRETFEEIETHARAFVDYIFCNNLHGEDAKRFNKWVESARAPQDADGWVLCNHSTGEVVRLATEILGPLIVCQGLLKRLHWIYPRLAIWAGDRVEFTTADRMVEREWKDVSMAICREIMGAACPEKRLYKS